MSTYASRYAEAVINPVTGALWRSSPTFTLMEAGTGAPGVGTYVTTYTNRTKAATASTIGAVATDANGNLSFFADPSGSGGVDIFQGGSLLVSDVRPVPDAASVSALLGDRGDWATATVYAQGAFTWINGARAEATVAHTSGTLATDLAAGKWKFHGTPRHHDEYGSATARLAVTTPAYVPIKTGTFTPWSSTIELDCRVQAGVDGMSGVGIAVFIGPVSQGRRPRPYYQGETRVWAQDIQIGTMDPNPSNIIYAGHKDGGSEITCSRRVKVTGLTSGVQYNYDLCAGVVGAFDVEGPAIGAQVALTGCTDVTVARSVEQTLGPFTTVDQLASHVERGAYVACVICTDGVRLVRVPGLGMVFTPYVWKTLTPTQLGSSTCVPVAACLTPDGTKFVVVSSNSPANTSKLTVINVKDGTVAATWTLGFAPKGVQAWTSNNTVWVTLDTAPGGYLIQYNLNTGAAGGLGISVTSSAFTPVLGGFRIPSWNATFACVAAGSTVKVYGGFGDTGTPVLVFTITHVETVQAVEVSFDATKVWVTGASGKVYEYPLATTSTPNWFFQVFKTTDRTTAVARNWVSARRFPGTRDDHLFLASSDAPAGGASSAYVFYEIDVTNSVERQNTQWSAVGSDSTNVAAGGLFLTDDGGIFATAPSKNTLDFWYGCVFDLDPSFFLSYGHAEVNFSPATA